MNETELLERRIGTTLRGKWTLERLLGFGGMAAVYIGQHKIGRRDAIKILHPEVAAHKEIARRFEQEAHAVNRFQHPGAVQIVDIDVAEDGAPFLVMELLDGESLAKRLERGPLEPAVTLKLLDELLDVLAAAHAHGIVHRDIKPDNLFILRDGRLKVLDFGIAQMRQGAPRTMHTAIGTTMGTLSYMPPEQVAGKEIDGRSDLFAVGCTLFEIIAGRPPHEGDTDLALMVKMAMEPAPPLASVAPHAPPELCMLVDRALAFEPSRRYPDAMTMQQDVRALLAGQAPPYAASRLSSGDFPNPSVRAASPEITRAGLPIASAPAASVAIAPAASVRTPNPPRRGKEVWLAVGGIALMLVVLGIAILVRLGRQAPDPEATLATDPPPNATPAASAETSRSSRAVGPLPDRRGARQPGAPTTAPPGRTGRPVIMIQTTPQGQRIDGE